MDSKAAAPKLSVLPLTPVAQAVVPGYRARTGSNVTLNLASKASAQQLLIATIPLSSPLISAARVIPAITLATANRGTA